MILKQILPNPSSQIWIRDICYLLIAKLVVSLFQSFVGMTAPNPLKVAYYEFY